MAGRAQMFEPQLNFSFLKLQRTPNDKPGECILLDKHQIALVTIPEKFNALFKPTSRHQLLDPKAFPRAPLRSSNFH
jgi:hypothetical protein